MATKPAVALSRWADQIGANLLTPSSGLRDLGFQEGTAAVAGYVNDELHQLYLWAMYLSDGALTGDHTIAGSLTVTADVDVGGDLAANGALAVGGHALVFATTTFTADNSTEIFTATAHGLQTGDGPVRVSNSGGALPAGLTAGTDYWIIRISANSFYLSDTFQKAMDGAFLSITTNGTGTQSVFSTVGTVRVSDATVSGDLSVGHNLTIAGEMYGARKKQIVPVLWAGTVTPPTSVADPGGLGVAVWNLPNNQTVRTLVPFEVGDIVTSFSVEVYGDGAVDWSAVLSYSADMTGSGGVNFGTTPLIINQPASWQTQSLTVSNIGHMADGGVLRLAITMGAGGSQLYLARIHLGIKRIGSV